jgi:GT2 family glycosyltransferase
VILVSYNTAALLKPCLDRLTEALAGFKSQVFVIDNASRDESARVLREHYSHYEIIVNAENVGFGRANNQVLDRIGGRFVLLLNTDAYVEPDALTRTVAYMDAHPRCGVLGVKLVGPDGALQPSCRYFMTPWNAFLSRTGASRLFPHARMVDDMSWDHASDRACDWVPGCFYLVRKEVIDAVGLFDPRYFLYYEEVDHCRAVKAAGWEVMYSPVTTVVHLGGESARSDSALTAGRQISRLQIESEFLYFRKHHGASGAWFLLFTGWLADSLSVLRGIGRPAWRQRLARAAGNARLCTAVFAATHAGRHATR